MPDKARHAGEMRPFQGAKETMVEGRPAARTTGSQPGGGATAFKRLQAVRPAGTEASQLVNQS